MFMSTYLICVTAGRGMYVLWLLCVYRAVSRQMGMEGMEMEGMEMVDMEMEGMEMEGMGE